MSLRRCRAHRAAVACLSLLASLAICTRLVADDEAAEWKPLFNGSDLEGWQTVGEPADCWEVTDGELHPREAGGWLSTKQEFADFELELEFNLPPGGNTGVFIRAPHGGRTSRLGMEIQLMDEFAPEYKNVKSWQRSGSLYDVEGAKSGALRPPGEWQKLALRCVGRRLEVKLNDQQVVDVDLDSYPDREEEHPGLKRTKGYIGLQNYGGRQTLFRNIRLRNVASP